MAAKIDQSVFSVPYPDVGYAGNLSGKNPALINCSDQTFWHRDTSILINEGKGFRGHCDERMAGKVESFEGLLLRARTCDAPIEVWSVCKHISKFGGPVAARALKELIEEPGETEFRSDVVYEAACQLSRMARGRKIPCAFPEHALSRAQETEISRWLTKASKNPEREHAKVIDTAVANVGLEPLERGLAKIGETIDLARLTISGALYRLAHRISPD